MDGGGREPGEVREEEGVEGKVAVSSSSRQWQWAVAVAVSSGQWAVAVGSSSRQGLRDEKRI